MHGIETDSAEEASSGAGGFTGPWNQLAFVIAAAGALYYVWVAAVGIRFPEIDRSLFILLGMLLAFMLKPLGSSTAARLVDVLLIGLAIAATVRFNVMYTAFLEMVGLPISDLDLALGWIMIFLSFEACRRVLGAAIPIMGFAFVAFLMLGPYVPQPFTHAGFDPRTIASYMYAGTDGIYGHITYVLASQMFLFLVFGAFLMRSGAADFFSTLSMALVGSRAGGTAKAAVASSTIVGSITGSAAANVAISGSMTIPLMKSAGFKPHVAGGIEAAASTGGTIMPPVMGVAAFIMVALTGIPYSEIVIYSATPALLYFFFVYMQVHCYARRNDLVGSPRETLPPVGRTLMAGWYYVAPVLVIAAGIFIGYSLAFIALLGIIATLVVSQLSRTHRMGPRDILHALAEGTKQALPIIVVAGPVAIIAQCLLLPGTGLRITGMIVSVGAGDLALTLGLVFVVAYILGMGLSVVPAYIILATLAAPALVRLDVPLIAAHLIVMWWGQASNITPPVSLASYVAASIAKAPLWRTGWAAVVKGAGLFLIPVLFAYQPGLLYAASPLENAVTIGSIIVGIVMASGGIEGFLFHRLSLAERAVLLLGAAVLLFGHSIPTITIGLIICAAALAGRPLVDRLAGRKRGAAG
ncbi:MAG: TRAP transporter fused permease subunit [Microvirga sp.]|nr:TRAP transporter fused permease subunit [Microvirga sp.]